MINWDKSGKIRIYPTFSDVSWNFLKLRWPSRPIPSVGMGHLDLIPTRPDPSFVGISSPSRYLEAQSLSCWNISCIVVKTLFDFRTLRPGQAVFVLGPKYDPSLTAARLGDGNDESRICDESVNIHSKSNHFHIMKAKVGRAYLLLGRDLEGRI